MLAFPRQNATTTTSASPATIAFSSNVLNAEWLYALSVSTTLTDTITGITDTRGSTWAVVAAVNVGSFRLECWRALSAGAGANTLSITYSAHTTAKRLWCAEVTGLGTAPTSASNSLDTTVAVDPIPGATLTVTGEGIALVLIQCDTSNSGWVWSPGFHTDMSGGTQGRAAIFPISADNASFAPLLDLASGTEAGESLTVAQYIDPQPSSGGGTSAVGSFG